MLALSNFQPKLWQIQLFKYTDWYHSNICINCTNEYLFYFWLAGIVCMQQDPHVNFACFEGATNGKSQGLINIVAKKLKSSCLLSCKCRNDCQFPGVFKHGGTLLLVSFLLLLQALAFRLFGMYSAHTMWFLSEYFSCIQYMFWETLLT